MEVRGAVALVTGAGSGLGRATACRLAAQGARIVAVDVRAEARQGLAADTPAAERFLREVDSACVFLNVSNRFADGGEFGFGAEIGISTDKLHARGPMGLRELTSYQYRVRGNGQIRG